MLFDENNWLLLLPLPNGAPAAVNEGLPDDLNKFDEGCELERN